MANANINNIYPVYNPSPINFTHGKGAYLYDDQDKSYLDFASGIAVNSLGHCHPHMVEALSEQARKLWHISNMYKIEGQERLAQRLCSNSFADRVFFTNSGSEAIECAIKTARRYFAGKGENDKYRIITFQGAFHGRTHAAIAAAGRLEYLAGFGPPLEGFDQASINDVEEVEGLIGPSTAAIMLEVVSGEGGINVWQKSALQEVVSLAKKNNLLIILDEVQCGNGRTGTFFAYEQFDIVPDIVATAKGIGSGFPLGACLASEKVAHHMTPGTHGSTYGGNPLAMAVGNAFLDIVENEDFLPKVSEIGYFLGERLNTLLERYDVIEEIRGLGLMRGIKFGNGVKAADIRKTLMQDHCVLTAVAAQNVVRVLPPLIIDQNHINQFIDSLESTLDSVVS